MYGLCISSFRGTKYIDLEIGSGTPIPLGAQGYDMTV
jgi:hypothetical protein